MYFFVQSFLHRTGDLETKTNFNEATFTGKLQKNKQHSWIITSKRWSLEKGFQIFNHNTCGLAPSLTVDQKTNEREEEKEKGKGKES